MNTRIEYIDFAKGYAIFTIVCYHALQRVAFPPLWQKAIVFGGTGIHLFFLLSGFGLGLSQYSGLSMQFYQRRLMKVWLPYILVLTISLLAAVNFGLFPDRFDAWLAAVGLYQMFSEQYIESFGGHFWFVSTIIQFYLVYPALVWIKTKLENRVFFLLALAISAAWWLLVYLLDKGGLRTWNSCFLQFLWEFALGMVLADGGRRAVDGGRWTVDGGRWTVDGGRWTVDGGRWTVDGGRWTVDSGRKFIEFWSQTWWASLSIALIFTALMALMILKMGDAGRIFNDIPALIGYTSFSVLFFQLGKKFFPPLKRFFLWVGGFSYSLYLVHILVLETWLKVLDSGGIPLNGLNLLPFLALALLAGTAFEPISQKWTRLFTKRS